MRIRHWPYSIPGQWVTGFTILGLIIAPTVGCNEATTITSLTGTQTAPFGILLNNDPAGGVLAGLRIASGESVWVYGSLKDDGTIKQITGLVLRDTNGHEASVAFDDRGRVTKGRALDGSTLDIAYDDSMPDHLAGTVDLFVATTGDKQTVPFDVDLKEAAAQIAKTVKDLTGIEISDKELPSGPPRIRVADLSGLPDGKQHQSESFLSALAGLYVFIYASTGFLLLSIMTQVMKFVVDFYVAYITTFVRVAVLAAFTPFIIMGNLLRGALDQPSFILNFNIIQPTVIIPAPPRL